MKTKRKRENISILRFIFCSQSESRKIHVIAESNFKGLSTDLFFKSWAARLQDSCPAYLKHFYTNAAYNPPRELGADCYLRIPWLLCILEDFFFHNVGITELTLYSAALPRNCCNKTRTRNATTLSNYAYLAYWETFVSQRDNRGIWAAKYSPLQIARRPTLDTVKFCIFPFLAFRVAKDESTKSFAEERITIPRKWIVHSSVISKS